MLLHVSNFQFYYEDLAVEGVDFWKTERTHAYDKYARIEMPFNDFHRYATLFKSHIGLQLLDNIAIR